MILEELETTVQKFMLLEDKSIIKLICAIVIAGRLPIAPPWMVICGAPSGGKSTLLSALEDCVGVFKIDDLTPQTFFSGMKGKDGEDMSLMNKLIPNSILTMKDFSTILSKKETDLGIILAQLRKIYDGDFDKVWGNGKIGKWNSKISLLIGSTPAIFGLLPKLSDLGERFMIYVFEQPERISHGMKATETLDERPAKKEMRDIFTKFIENIKIPKETPNIDEETRLRLVELAEFATRARTAVPRNKFMKGQPVESITSLEAPPRFSKQLISIAIGLRTINENEGKKGLTDPDRLILYKVALDSILNTRRLVLQTLTRFAKAETKAIALKIAYPVESVRLWLQDLAILKVITFTQGTNKRDNWELKSNFRILMGRYEHIELTDEILIDEDLINEAPLNEPPPNVPEYMIE